MEEDTLGLRKRMQKKAVGGVCVHAVIEKQCSYLLPRGGSLWAEPTFD